MAYIYIYLHLVDLHGFHVAKYTSPMDPMGLASWLSEGYTVIPFITGFEDPPSRSDQRRMGS